ncbi:TPA: ParB/RepB/Spo0J family partition protein [Neisseria meningitidis]|uniref:ParB/RepB/Spo0J family partition protein n=1 Tax=Neisseria meningitidis TaxID=487 RepID=UPI0001FC07D0|nr:ParB/RepB/Spo0J family partition protein [Neisseria meningitidis]EGC63976.1 putative chromosome partitioning protein parB [Neisseria meningitidis 961-5945]MBW3887079.1 ParB/RepB/Spo0J family partition protein [Neisseria meningitidis]MCL4973874.1 ParB/RepB/Spo0J family partition protein [Neisseria meningitidis]MCL5865884.1 ParB/RepB/Spo0J family partition protein [Neisseria meningitidis]MCL5870654.1 ParB/RepB/Spo0J family partition protein [Neisseria meningitidis]
MAKVKGGLGRGLDSLLANGADNSSGDRLTTVAVKDIRPGRYQARVQIDDEALQELADSIKAQGVIQPVIVREHGLSRYELIAGERRWRAAQIAGLTEIPAVIKTISDETALAMGLIENLQRENLNPIEEAQGLKRLADEFGLTHETIAQAVGKSRSAISNSLRLLSLPGPVQEMLYQRRLEMGHARALLTLPVVEQLELAQKAVKNGWSVREVERRSQAAFQNKRPEPKKTAAADIGRLNDLLTEKLGVNAEIKTANHKKGKIILHFDTPETFDHILKQLGIDYRP